MPKPTEKRIKWLELCQVCAENEGFCCHTEHPDRKTKDEPKTAQDTCPIWASLPEVPEFVNFDCDACGLGHTVEIPYPDGGKSEGE